MGFRIVGCVLMPEHCHLLIWPSQATNPSEVMQSLKERTAKFVLKNLHENPESAWCARMQKRLELPASVHHPAHYRVWQRRFYDMNVWSQKKLLEKLNYMHNNPVKRGLVAEPGDWPWSSWRFYHLGDCSILEMDALP